MPAILCTLRIIWQKSWGNLAPKFAFNILSVENLIVDLWNWNRKPSNCKWNCYSFINVTPFSTQYQYLCCVSNDLCGLQRFFYQKVIHYRKIRVRRGLSSLKSDIMGKRCVKEEVEIFYPQTDQVFKIIF